MNNSNTWQEIYEESSFGNDFASSYLVSFFHNRIKPILLKNKKIEDINVLDFGCSFGANSQIFNKCGMNVYGIDVSELAIEGARKRVSGRFETVNLLEEELKVSDVFGGVTFDLIIASECMYYFTNNERRILNKKFKDVMSDAGLIYINMPTYDCPPYVMYKDIVKNDEGMVMVSQTGRVDNALYVNIPHSVEEVKEMFNEFKVLDVVTTDMPLYSTQRNIEYHLLAQK